MSIVAFTDGSCIGNGKDHAYGGYGVYFPGDDARNVAEPLLRNNNGDMPVTNNRAELRAVLAAMQSVCDRAADLTIMTDSQYWERYVSKAAFNHKRDIPEHLENRDLLYEIRAVYNECYLPNERRVVSEYVPAHTGKKDALSMGNDIADTLSVMGSAKDFVLLGLHTKTRLKTGRYKGKTYVQALLNDREYFANSPSPNKDKMTRLIFEVLDVNGVIDLSPAP